MKQKINYSIIITAFKEEKTIGLAIKSIASQSLKNAEIVVISPDEPTLNEAKRHIKTYKNLRVIKDLGKGKPAALNLSVKQTNGDILILTDGDVSIAENSLDRMLEKFKDKNVGAVTGRPISLNNKNNKYGYWAFLLTEIAHLRRKTAIKKNKRFFCSGYLFAIRKSLFPNLPEELLSEDGYISHKVYEKGFKLAYSENSIVKVKYPTNFKDWIKQKKRSAGGYNQNKKLLGVEIRSFKKESLGFLEFFQLIKSPIHLVWLIELFIARIYLWVLIYKDINLKKKKRDELWQRVDSTK